MKIQPNQSRSLALALATVVGCGTANDQEQTARPSTDDTRYEIVIVDSSEHVIEENETQAPVDIAPTPAAPAGTSATPPPPPPGIDDEAGGDQLLAFAPEGRFVIQVGVFSDVAKARARVRELMDLGYPAFLIKREGGRQTRVRIGFFSSREDADLFGQRFVRDHGGEYWIDLHKDGGN